MQKIQQVSTKIIYFLDIALILYPSSLFLTWSLMDHSLIKKLIQEGILLNPIVTPEGSVNLGTIPLTTLSKGIGILGSFLGAVPLLWGLWRLKKLFHNYKKGNVFSIENVQTYQVLGWLFFLDGLLAKPISEMLMILTATLSNPVGHRYISLSFGTPNLESLFCGVLIIVISWVMREGYKLQEDQELTI